MLDDHGQPILHEDERVLVLTPDRDSGHLRPGGKPMHDFGNVFAPESKLLARFLAPAVIVRVATPEVDASLVVEDAKKQRAFESAARDTLRALGEADWTRVIVLCHGWPTGIQLGFRS